MRKLILIQCIGNKFKIAYQSHIRNEFGNRPLSFLDDNCSFKHNDIIIASMNSPQSSNGRLIFLRGEYSDEDNFVLETNREILKDLVEAVKAYNEYYK
jgi:hypothetical protein